MLKRYFLKIVFPDLTNLTTDTEDIGENLLPLTAEKAKKLIENQQALARECIGYPATVTIWVEHEDGTQEEILLEDLE